MSTICRHFRDQLIAAPLKPISVPVDYRDQCVAFPRSADRGPIEARPYADAGDWADVRFPRSADRGPIEADAIRTVIVAISAISAIS